MSTDRKKECRALIVKCLEEKATLKQDVYQNTLSWFKELKLILEDIAADLNSYIHKKDPRVTIEFKARSEFELELKVAGDLLIFYMHTNVFQFDRSHPMWKSSYLKEDDTRSFCGMLMVYNFLNDSFKYNRLNDIGYLLARIFINRENHYMVEGKRQLGFLYNDFPKNIFSKESLRSVIESVILYSLDFDLLTPPFDTLKEVSVAQMQEASQAMQLKTGKRLGFRFQADSDLID